MVLLLFYDIKSNSNAMFSLCMVCRNPTHTGNTLDLEDMQVLRAQLLPACNRLQVVPPELLVWVWVLLVNQVLQILMRLRLLGRDKDSGLEVIQALIIRIIGVVSFCFFCSPRISMTWLLDAGYYGQQPAGQQGAVDGQLQGPV